MVKNAKHMGNFGKKTQSSVEILGKTAKFNRNFGEKTPNTWEILGKVSNSCKIRGKKQISLGILGKNTKQWKFCGKTQNLGENLKNNIKRKKIFVENGKIQGNFRKKPKTEGKFLVIMQISVEIL